MAGREHGLLGWHPDGPLNGHRERDIEWNAGTPSIVAGSGVLEESGLPITLERKEKNLST
jgi:hypothetical protein